jgi:hypothetical protein
MFKVFVADKLALEGLAALKDYTPLEIERITTNEGIVA